MKPFCGYNFADYWAHWLSFSERTDKLPKIFHVNWFRQNAAGDFLWPGFGENLRVLKWIIDRCEDRVEAVNTPIGYLPHAGDLDTSGLDINEGHLAALTTIDAEQWKTEMDAVADYLESYGDRLPPALRDQQRAIRAALS